VNSHSELIAICVDRKFSPYQLPNQLEGIRRYFWDRLRQYPTDWLYESRAFLEAIPSDFRGHLLQRNSSDSTAMLMANSFSEAMEIAPVRESIQTLVQLAMLDRLHRALQKVAGKEDRARRLWAEAAPQIEAGVYPAILLQEVRDSPVAANRVRFWPRFFGATSALEIVNAYGEFRAPTSQPADPEAASEADPNEECPICQEAGPNETTRCGHRFHRACLNQWINRGHNNCPMCRGSDPRQ
jgi:hypothetical protein